MFNEKTLLAIECSKCTDHNAKWYCTSITLISIESRITQHLIVLKWTFSANKLTTKTEHNVCMWIATKYEFLLIKLTSEYYYWYNFINRRTDNEWNIHEQCVVYQLK